jgi:long-chain acyl-CoA synthetase
MNVIDRVALRRVFFSLLRSELRKLRPWDPRIDDTLALGRPPLTEAELDALAQAVGSFVQISPEKLKSYPKTCLHVSWAERIGELPGAPCFATGGSTSCNRNVHHTAEVLHQEIDFWCRHLTKPGRVIACVPPHHIYGFLWTVLLPQALGVIVYDFRERDESLLCRLEAGDLVVAHPGIWNRIAERSRAFPGGVQGISSGGPLLPGVAKTLVERGLLSLVEVYGSTETAAIGFRYDEEHPYLLLPWWERGREDQTLVRTLPSGEPLTVRAPDLLEWIGTRCVRPQGRVDGAVQVSGVNVFPDDVARRLMEHPAVLQAAVRLMRPAEGMHLKTFIALRPEVTDSPEIRADIRSWASSRLAGPERPRSFQFGTALPTGELGKLSDWPVDPPRRYVL